MKLISPFLKFDFVDLTVSIRNCKHSFDDHLLTFDSLFPIIYN